MEKTELTSQVINDIVINDFKENHIPPSSVMTSTSQLHLKTTDCDIKDTIHSEISNCGDQLVPGDSSGELENCEKSESSSDERKDMQAIGHVVPSETSSDERKDMQAIGHVVPSETSSDERKDMQAIGHVVLSETSSDERKDMKAIGHVVPSETSSDERKDMQAIGHVVPSETSSDERKDMQATGHVVPSETSSDERKDIQATGHVVPSETSSDERKNIQATGHVVPSETSSDKRKDIQATGHVVPSETSSDKRKDIQATGHVVPSETSSDERKDIQATGHVVPSETSSDERKNIQATGHVVPSETSSDKRKDIQATGHVVPSETSSDERKDMQTTGHVVPSETSSDERKNIQATGHVVPSETSSDERKNIQATGHVVPSETSSDERKDMQATGHVDKSGTSSDWKNDMKAVDHIVQSETTICDIGNYCLSDFSKKNLKNSQWLVASQTDFNKDASSVLEDQLMTITSNDGAENVYQIDASYNNLQNGDMILFEAASNDHLVPTISTDNWENIDLFVPEYFEIDNTQDLCCASSYEETTSNDSQLVPEIPNDNSERNHSLNEISIFNFQNYDHVSEASHFVRKHDTPIPDSSEVRWCCKSELEPRTTDFSDENKELKCDLLIPCMKQAGNLKDVIDSQSNLTDLELNHSNNDHLKPELSGDSGLLSCETTHLEIRFTNQLNLETQVFNLKINTPSSSEESNLNVSECKQSKPRQCEGDLKNVDEFSESDVSLYHQKHTLPGGSTASKESSMGFCCEGNDFSQSNNYPVSSMTTAVENSRFSYTRNVSQPLHHIVPEYETVVESSLTFLPQNRLTDLDSMWCNPSDVQQTCCVNESVQVKHMDTTSKCHGLGLVQFKQNESPNINPEVDNFELNPHEFDGKISSIRQRTVHKSPNLLDTYKSTSLSSSSAKKSHLIKNVWAIMALALLVLTVTCAYLFSAPETHYTPSLNTFKDHINNIKQTFPSQSEDFWKTVRASVFSVFNKDEFKQPVVVIIASSTSHAPVASCIAKHISAGFESSWNLSPNMSVIDVDRLKHLDAASQKLQLDNDISSFFETHRRKSLIVENLQFLDPRAALIFYSYCDTDNAPFKDVMILFTLYFDEKEEKVYSSSTVENFLEHMWRKGLTLDKVRPLVNRMAGNIVIVKGEDFGTLSDKCS